MASTLIGSKNHSVVAFDLTFKADKTVSLLHAFAAPVVAGIVEDAQTLELLRSYGVDFVQGYHLGRPGELKM